MVFSFGVYQELYQQLATEPGNPFTGQQPAVIDLIGTASAALQTMFAPLATAWCKRFPPRIVISSGGLLLAIAGLMASYSHTLWQVVLTQGVLMGFATCLSYITAVTVAPMHYGKRRALAMGIITAGTGVGGVMWGPVIQTLNSRLGWRNSLRISGAICGLTVILCGQALDWDPASKARLAAEKRALADTRLGQRLASLRPSINWQIARTPAFAASALGAGLQAAVYYAPIFYFSAFARTLGYGRATGANLIALSNACNALGKVAIGYLADAVCGRINALLVSTAISAAATLALWLPSSALSGASGSTGGSANATSRALFVAYVVIYGLTASAYVSLFPASLVELFGPAHFRNVNGVLYAIRGMAALAGTPAFGALIRGYDAAGGPSPSGTGTGADTGTAGSTTPNAYWIPITFAGILFAGATAGVAWVRIAASRASPNKSWKL